MIGLENLKDCGDKVGGGGGGDGSDGGGGSGVSTNIGLVTGSGGGVVGGGVIEDEGLMMVMGCAVGSGGLKMRFTVDHGGSESIRLNSKSALSVGATGATVTGSSSTVAAVGGGTTGLDCALKV